MANGITYFRLRSDYPGDVTKDCGLTGNEVDNNFYTLEGRDINSVTVDGDKIKITLLNGDVIQSDDVFTNYAKDLSFSYDADNGVLHVTQNGVTTDIEGFLCEASIINNYYELIEPHIPHDVTITGDGTKASPLSVSSPYRPGYYHAVDSIVRVNEGESLPSKDELKKGDRFLVVDGLSKYGLLYNYNGVACIASDLAESSSEWRIPTKEDWDDMLNEIEPCKCDKNHSTTGGNKYLGRFAGKFLKSRDEWKEYIPEESEDNYTEGTGCMCGRDIECNRTCCGEYGTCMHRISAISTAGVDKYGFTALPAGYADDGKLYGYFGERGAFWTATASPNLLSAYIKRLEYDKRNVYQDITPNSYYLSLRLVKEYDGCNYNGREVILGDSYDTVLMPSKEKGSRVWTSVNIALTNERYHGIQPNNGEGVETVPVYHIFEWDGCKWLTNQFFEGDMVTVLHDEEGKYSTEYKLINNELVSLRDHIAEDVIEIVRPLIDAETERAQTAEEELGNRIDTLEQGLADEIQARTDGDANLQTQVDEINEIISGQGEEIEGLLGRVEALEQDVEAVKEDITEKYNEVKEEIADKYDELDGKITEEKEAREQADAELAEKDNEIEGKLYKSQTGSFDPETGKLTIESNDGTNDLEVQFTFNFGTI